jgi:hypothetical protein
MMRVVRLFLCAGAFGVAPIGAARAAATPIILGGQETATNIFYGGPASAGFDFTPKINVNLTALGFWDFGFDGVFPGLGSVGLWQTAPESLLASATITSADPIDPSVSIAGGAWRYQTLATPIALAAGIRYTLGFLVTPGLNPSESLFLNYPTLVINPAVAIPNLGRSTSLTDTLQFPELIFPPANDVMRMMVNAQLDYSVPEPATALLVSSALTAGALRRHRRRTTSSSVG